MTEQDILKLGFRKHGDGYYSFFMGFNSFMHLILHKEKVTVYVGDTLDIVKCFNFYKTVKNIEDLKQLIRIIA
jgi:hypothetical protein